MDKLNERIAAIPLPERMRTRPISATGFPVPWFVAQIDGVYDFRVVDAPKVSRAVTGRLCWLCGQKLGAHLAFVIGPMCMVNRVSSEPPSHRECAEYAVRACPFLTQPRMRRNDHDLPEEYSTPAGIMLSRNPGVTALWMTRSYTIFKPQDGGKGSLFNIGPPDEVCLYCQGRIATRQEVLDSINSGLPALREIAAQHGEQAELDRMYNEALRLLPAA